MTERRPQVIVAQKGSREHFLAARALHRRGLLAQLVVDWYVPTRSPLVALGRHLPSRAVRRALGATCADLPDARVRSLGLFGLQRRFTERVAQARGAAAPYLESDSRFARRLATRSLPPHNAFFGYAYASLEMLEAEKARGHFTILDQIDPGQPEHRLVSEEAARWPAYAPPPAPVPDAYFARNRREWALADVILVNSEWTRDLLVKDGAPAEKLAIVPLAYERPASPPMPVRTVPRLPLRVLWLGTACLRKGIPYLVEAARLLTGEPVTFDVAGTLDISPAAITDAPRSIRWHGPVPRAQAAALFAASHVFVLPTISDGFGIVQLEALAHGLPVITTPNCARVVEDGRTGDVVPAGDAEALAEAILRYVRNPERAAAMAAPCAAAAARYTIDAYAEHLERLLAGAEIKRS